MLKLTGCHSDSNNETQQFFSPYLGVCDTLDLRFVTNERIEDITHLCDLSAHTQNVKHLPDRQTLSN